MRIQTLLSCLVILCTSCQPEPKAPENALNQVVAAEESMDIDRLEQQIVAHKASASEGDTAVMHQVTKLNTEFAQRLVARADSHLVFPELKVLNPESALILAQRRHPKQYRNMQLSLSFPALTQLDEQTAQALAKTQGKKISLSALTSVSAEATKWLAKAKVNELQLNGLRSLPPEIARALAQFTGETIQLNGITALSVQTMEILQHWQGCKGGSFDVSGLQKWDNVHILINNCKTKLYLDGLQSLEQQNLAQVADKRFRSKVYLRGIKRLDKATATHIIHNFPWMTFGPLSPETQEAELAVAVLNGDGQYIKKMTKIDLGTAKLLRNFRHRTLPLHSLEAIDPQIAASLTSSSSHFVRELQLDGLTSLDRQTADLLGKWSRAWEKPVYTEPHALSLQGLTSIDHNTASALAQFVGRKLDLSGLTYVSPKVAKELAQFQGGLHAYGVQYSELYLNGMTTLSPATAAAFAKYRGDMYCNGLQSIKPQTAKVLAGFDQGIRLHLPNLRRVDAKVAAAMRHWKVDELELGQVTTLSAKAARQLGGFPGGSINLDGLSKLDASTAKSLSTFQGKLSLNGVRQLSSRQAKALANSKAYSLSLQGLTTITPEVAQLLAQFGGDELLLGMTAIDIATAKSLARFQGKSLFLQGLMALDEPTALALIQFKGKQLKLGSEKSPFSKEIREFLYYHLP